MYFAAPSASPNDLTAENISSTSISIYWSPLPRELLNGELTHYSIEVQELDTNTTMKLTAVATEVVLDYLHPFYTYYISVSAVTVLPGPYTEQLSIRTLEDGMCVANNYDFQELAGV